MAKILIADSLSPAVVKMLTDAGHEVKMDAALTDATLPEAIDDYNVLVVRSTKVTRATVEAAKGLNLIVRAGAGVNTIDIEACSEKGIFVTNTPGCNNDAVAELAFGHILACDREIVKGTEFLRNGEWKKKLFLQCTGLRGKVLGIVGRGNIARSLVRIAKGVGMHVVMYSRSFTEAEAKEMDVEFATSLLDIARKSDVVSVHVSFNKTQTFHYISGEFFNNMKDGAIFVNTSRGEIVDTGALIRAIEEKKLKVGLDVYENEPTVAIGDFNQAELARLACSATSHIGASTKQAADVIALATKDVILTFLSTGTAMNCVNIDQMPAASHSVSIRHNGVIADIVACLASHNVQITSMSNVVLKGEKSQSVSMRIKGDASVKDALLAIQGVIGVSLN